MNAFSFSLIAMFGLLLGFIFPDLLEELGLSKKSSHSWIAVFFLSFLSFLGFFTFPLFTSGVIAFNDLSNFYSASGGVFLGLAVAFLIGGGVHLAVHFVQEQRKT